MTNHQCPAMRVVAPGGGRCGPRERPGGCYLAQRGELERGIQRALHTLAKRALVRAGGRRGREHVFGSLPSGSDGTREGARDNRTRDLIWLYAAVPTPTGCKRN